MKNISCRECKDKSNASCILNPEEFNTLDKNCVEITYKKGENIVRQGTFSEEIKFLKTGLVKVHITISKKEKILYLAKSPSYLGIPTTFADRINQHSVTALEDSTVCFIPSEIFRNFISKNGDFALEIVLDLCRNDFEDRKRYVDQFQKQPKGRLANILLCMADKFYKSNSFNLPLSRTELADLIGTKYDSLYRALLCLTNDHIIQLKGKEVTILKEDILKEISLID